MHVTVSNRWNRCLLMVPPWSFLTFLGCPSIDRWDGLFRQSERSRSAASQWARASQNSVPGKMLMSVHLSHTHCHCTGHFTLHKMNTANNWMFKVSDCVLDPAVSVCNVAVWNWVQRERLHRCCDGSQPRRPQRVRWGMTPWALLTIDYIHTVAILLFG